MQVFISVKVPRQDAARRALTAQVCQIVQDAGAVPFLAYAEIERAGLSEPTEFMPYVRQRLAHCDLCLLLYEPELRGGLIEAGIAYALGVPVWLLHAVGEPVSSSARGIAGRILAYASRQQLADELGRALSAAAGIRR